MTTPYHPLLLELQHRDFSPQEWTARKREWAIQQGLATIPSNIQILIHAPQEVLGKIKAKLLTKPIRTASGVAPVALMTAPSRCPHGKCTFCPGGIGSPWGDVPQSYTGHEPATMRGIRNNYDSYLMAFNRLEQYVLLGHTLDKVEFIIMGGTFPATPHEYQEEFILDAFKALNDFSALFFDAEGNLKIEEFKEFFELPGEMRDQERIQRIQEKVLRMKRRDLGSAFEILEGVSNGLRSRSVGNQQVSNMLETPQGLQQEQPLATPLTGAHMDFDLMALPKSQTTLEHEQQRNETAHIRCVALCIETKPDWGFLEHGNEMLRQGCTRVELGVESVYDDVLAFTHRGHTAADTIKSIQVLRDLGFKINFHYMPGLPLTDRERDISGMKQLFDDPDYRPDMIKLYPTMVAPGTALFHQWKQEKFEPISTEEAALRVVEFKRSCPEYCRIQRIQRDVPTKYWSAGVDRTNFRQYIHEHYPDALKCRCIRCREPRGKNGKNVNWDAVKITVQEYAASRGKEFFIASEDAENDLLIWFCRLRFPAEFLRPEITPESALIRELHVYGTATAIGDEGVVQHRGWGKKLMEKAEEIAREQGKKKMVVISGVGVREYYRKLGYVREGMYMVKEL